MGRIRVSKDPSQGLIRTPKKKGLKLCNSVRNKRKHLLQKCVSYCMAVNVTVATTNFFVPWSTMQCAMCDTIGSFRPIDMWREWYESFITSKAEIKHSKSLKYQNPITPSSLTPPKNSKILTIGFGNVNIWKIWKVFENLSMGYKTGIILLSLCERIWLTYSWQMFSKVLHHYIQHIGIEDHCLEFLKIASDILVDCHHKPPLFLSTPLLWLL